ncbi:MAG: hypothetical protein J6Z43_09975 [Clostridiales bacterium]|nr:hypothetical protein [Clostridiales bacterium]
MKNTIIITTIEDNTAVALIIPVLKGSNAYALIYSDTREEVLDRFGNPIVARSASLYLAWEMACAQAAAISGMSHREYEYYLDRYFGLAA